MKHLLLISGLIGCVVATACSVVDPGSSTAPRPSLGIHVVSSDFDRPEAVEEIIGLNAGWVRVNIGNRLATREKSMERWSTRLRALHEAGVGILATVYCRDGRLPNRFPESTEDLDVFRNNLTTLASHLGTYVDIWQLENELTLDHHWPKSLSGPDRGRIYAACWKVFSETLRNRNPNAELTIFGLAGSTGWHKIRNHYLDPLLEADPKGFDVLDIHCHTSHAPDIQYVPKWNKVRDSVSEALGRRITIVSTEGSTWSGKPTDRHRQSEHQMATHLVRKDLALAAAGVRFTCFGPLANRKQWKKSEGPHRYSLNGLHLEGADGRRKMAADSLERVGAIWKARRWRDPRLATDNGRITVTLTANKDDSDHVLWSRNPMDWEVPPEFDGWSLVHLCGQIRQTTVRSGDRLRLNPSPKLLTRQPVPPAVLRPDPAPERSPD